MTISNHEWVTSGDPCFDLVCKDSECIPKSTAFNLKKERLTGTDCNQNDCDIDHGLPITANIAPSAGNPGNDANLSAKSSHSGHSADDHKIHKKSHSEHGHGRGHEHDHDHS